MSRPPVCLLPGPVPVAPAVWEALTRPQLSHRAPAFRDLLGAVRGRLRELTGAARVHLLTGGGTLANDVLAAQLSRLPGRGLVLVSGEFGRRLTDHARGAGLDFRILERPWGQPIPPGAVAGALDEAPAAWLWATHCETSTGELLDLPGLVALCRERGVLPCFDCISSLGLAPVDLSGVAWASAVSGKGVGAFPGLALLLGQQEAAPSRGGLPPALDLERYQAAAPGVPFTLGSPLLGALAEALSARLDPGDQEKRGQLSGRLREALGQRGFLPLVEEKRASPAVTTYCLPPELSSETVGTRLEEEGFLLSFRSSYLLERNWIQVCLMGEVDPGVQEALEELPETFERACRRG